MNTIQTVNKALSDQDIRDILGSDCKIIEYSDLEQYRSLEDLLPQPRDYVVILYQKEENSGHWIGLLKYDNMYGFFDPYGLMPDKQLSWVNLKS